MLDSITLFVNKITSFGGFKRSEISNKAYAELLTSVQGMLEQGVVVIPSLVNKHKHHKGELIIDTTNNPKYGLKKVAIKMKNLSNGGYSKGFKIVLFLYKVKDRTIPLGFALIHKESSSQEVLVLEMLKRLRNKFKLKPKMTLADAAFSTQKVIKKLNNYGWGFVFKGKKTYSLDNKQIKKQIPRGYGSQIGKLKNDVKVKVLRRSKRVFITNRVSLTDEKIIEHYSLRWKIEETFRVLKSCIGLNCCQQHSIRAQEIYIFGCLVLYAIIETIRGESAYKAFQNVFLGDTVIDNSLVTKVLVM